MITAEFEERSYEGPLYNQLERGYRDVFQPGQVLESRLGFDHGTFLMQTALWEILGYDHPLCGVVLGNYRWGQLWGLDPRKQLPRFRLNLFLQAKRPVYYRRKPRALRTISTIGAPLWRFKITQRQQRLLETLSERTRGRAHVAYAAAAFHTNSALHAHTKYRTIIQNSTFPSVDSLKGHDAWYYQQPGAQGAANPTPESIEEEPLIHRVRVLAQAAEPLSPGNLEWLDTLAADVIASAHAIEEVDAAGAQFFDDLQTLERLLEEGDVRPSLRAYAQVVLFVVRSDLNWLVIGDA